jgi:hypothetical protein
MIQRYCCNILELEEGNLSCLHEIYVATLKSMGHYAHTNTKIVSNLKQGRF